jgi:putative transposase
MKYRTIYRYEGKYSISEMARFFKVSRSGYYGWTKQMCRADKDQTIADWIAECQSKNRQTYGYRRVQVWLDREKGVRINHKAILRVMNKTNQLACIRRRRRWVQYGQQLHRYPNLLNRDFNAEKPNQKWATDITYILLGKDDVLYLSVIKDLYDGSIVSYKVGTEQSTRLVLDTIRAARKTEKVADGLVLHSDQGFQYTSRAYFDLSQQYGFTPSMSRAANPYDNASMENFFGILKCECLRRYRPRTYEEASLLVDDFIYYYNNYRICLKTKLTPYEKRCQFA